MPDPVLEIKGGGGVGRNRSQKQFFSAVRASVWSKNRGGGGSPGSDTDNCNEMARDIDNVVQRKIK